MPLLIGAILFDYRKWRDNRWLTITMYVVVVLALCAVFGFRPVNGSRRWLMFGPVRIQPSEFAKIAVVIATAVFLDKAGWRIELFWKGAVRALCIIGLPMALAVAEPEAGAYVHENAVIGRVGEIPVEAEEAAHIHLEVRVNGKLTDPLELMGLDEAEGE